jgi:adenylate kinase
MIIAITGTPGVGKTSVADVLIEKGFEVVHLFKTAVKNGFILSEDKIRGSKILDMGRLDDYINKNYGDKDLVLIDGHLSYLLKCVNKVIVLRCHPGELTKRLSKKGWDEEKIWENVQAEILDVILCDTVDIFSFEDVFEIDTTDKTIEDIASAIIEIKNNDFKHMKKYNIGNIDWSEAIFKDF